MAIDLNRRIFLALLGTAAASAAALQRPRAPRRTSPATNKVPACFLSDTTPQPPTQPKSSAITYLDHGSFSPTC